MTLRELMLDEMLTEIGNPNNNSRYGCYFYIPRVEETRRERKFNTRAREDGKINLQNLHDAEDEALLDAYRKYQRRYNTWM
jgi:hypothetical protein